NVISGNRTNGILTNSTAANTIAGNIIGLQANGNGLLSGSSQACGVNITNSGNNHVGNGTSAGRNIISGNGTNGGIFITGTSSGNLVRGNFIGPDITGTVSLSGNGQVWGVTVQSLAANNVNTIGGTNSGDGNVLSGNSGGSQ